jgi:PAS domain S-box-containing protein
MNKADTLHFEQKINHLQSDIAAITALQQEKNHLQLAFQNSQMLFKNIFEQSAYGNKLIDSSLKIIRVNKALLKLLGYSKKELLGSHITDIAHPDFVKHWEKLQHHLWTANKPSFSVDTCLVKKDKSYVWCHVTSILLKDNGETLGYTILENISERKVLERNLKEANNRELLLQQQLLEATIDAQENERLHIAEEVHNGLAQLLYGVKLGLDKINLENPEQQKENHLAFENAKNLLFDSIKECRRISYNLRPSVLEQFGLKAAIEDMCKQVSGTINFRFHLAGFHQRLPKLLEVAIYRIAQELTSNVIKHARATKASIKLILDKENIIITVEDNGIGFNILNIKDDCIGIRSIESRLHLLNGKINILSVPGAGTAITIHFPSDSF